MKSLLNIVLLPFRLLARLIAAVLGALFGRWQWQSPTWMQWCSAKSSQLWSHCKANPKRSASIFVACIAIVAASFAGYRWYQLRPKPVETTFSYTAPPLTVWDDVKAKYVIQPLVVQFSDSAAPLSAIGQPVKSGISMSPNIAGSWRWEDDKKLVFQPANDWPVGASFTVDFDKKKFFAPQVRLDTYDFSFQSAPFTTTVVSNEFYQDPVDPQLKKLVASIHFSHPVETADFEKRIAITLAKDATFLGLNADATGFAVTYDKQRLNAYIHSRTLQLPREDTRMLLTLDKGIRSARGGDGTPAKIESSITVPGRFSLQFPNLSMTLVDNEHFEPEQVLLLESSAPLAGDALKNKVKAWLLPAYRPGAKEAEKKYLYAWSKTEIGKDIIAQSEALPLEQIPGEDAAQSLHSFKFHAPVGRSVYVEVAEGVQAVGGSQSGKPFTNIVQVQPYPRALNMLGDGAILSLSGERKIGFMARGVDGVQIEVGRLLANQLHQLVDVNFGPFAKPNMSSVTSDRLVERFIEKRKLVVQGPGKPVYDSIDLGAYLKDKSHSRYGIFLIKMTEAQPDADSAAADEDADTQQDSRDAESGEGGEGEYDQGASEYGESNYDQNDTRLVVITDLGLLVKRELDGSQVVFVQSIHTGLPVAGVKIDLLGRNGLAVQTQTSDANGKARFAPVDKLLRDKTPLLFTAEKDGDISFLPLNRGDRQLNLSRFDIGGIENNRDANRLSAFLFSDRGIYRPGENVHIGTIVRTQDWRAALDGIPVEAEVTDPRGMTLLRQKMQLGKAGFEELNWSTQPSSPTGHYQVSLYLVKNEDRKILLGSTSVRVQEFEPDRMKVSAQLSDQPADGWLTPDQIQARVKAMQLFGAPAANRRVEAEMKITPAVPAFARYRDYVFFDRTKLNESYSDTLAPATTDDNGDAKFDLNLTRFERATYRLSILARAFEAEGGRNVAAFSAALVSSAPYLVGVKAEEELGYLQRDSKHASRWLAVDQKLNGIALADIKQEWVQRKFVSVLTKQNNGTYRYQSRRKDIVRDTKPLALAANGSDIELPTSEAGDFSLVLRDKDGLELNRLEYSVVGAANLSRSLERNAELQIKLDKKEYEPGDTIELSIQAPYIGSGLITIERDKVYQHIWFKTSTTSSVQKIKLPDDFEGNGYVSVQFLRDPSSDEIFMSPLSYGVMPFAVSLQHRTEPVKVEALPLVKPGQDLKLHVSTEKPSRVVVFAIDEGILQVAGYKKPEPLSFFFQKRMLDVRTAQILDLILPEFQQLLNAAAPGGDGDASLGRHVNPFKRKNRPPTAYWSGIVDVDASGKDLHYTVPDYYNGKLHIFAVAVSAQTIGVYEGGSEVRGDLILSPNLPAMVATGDEFNVSVSIFNNVKGSASPINLQAITSPGLTVIGDKQIKLTIAEQKEGVAQLRLKATDALGAAEIKFVATINDKGVDKKVNATESLSVRPASTYRVQTTADRQTRDKLTLKLSRDLYKEYRDVHAVYGYSPLAWSSGLSAYLANYPYSCTEQLVSMGMPALLLGAHPELGKIIDANKPENSFDELIKTLRTRQNDEGGFGLWSSTTEVAPWPSIYAIHFLLEAKERGRNVPADVLANANSWLRREAGPRGDSLDDMRARAYAIYLLTRQGVVTSELLGTLQHELDARYAKEWPNDLTAAYVAGSYRLLQKTDLAEKIIKHVNWSQDVKNPALDPIAHGDYYDALIHDSQLLYIIAKQFPSQLRAVPATVLDNMGKQISGNRYSSLSAAYLLLALESYASAAAEQGGTLAIAEVDAAGNAKALPLPAGLIAKAAIGIDAKSVQFNREGNLPAFYSVVESGFDRTQPATEAREGLEIQRDYLDLKGNAISSVDVGAEFLVRLRLRTVDRDNAGQIAVVDLLPGGIEPVIERAVAVDPTANVDEAAPAPTALPIGVAAQSSWHPQFAEVRDDRMVLYGYLNRDVATFVYRVRATNVGEFQTPAPYAEGMYHRELYARGLGGKLSITPAK
ncbi:MAG: alpha-2-macroglobulin family protein [Verrucomicrobiaceae bacterium]|nr:alpha-2-macroglobulin family protein [Verrucomicrobiaceae bacterium]